MQRHSASRCWCASVLAVGGGFGTWAGGGAIASPIACFSRGGTNIVAGTGSGAAIALPKDDVGPIGRVFDGSAFSAPCPGTSGVVQGYLGANGGSATITWSANFHHAPCAALQNNAPAVYQHGRTASVSVTMNDLMVSGPADGPSIIEAGLNYTLSASSVHDPSPTGIQTGASYNWQILQSISQAGMIGQNFASSVAFTNGARLGLENGSHTWSQTFAVRVGVPISLTLTIDSSPGGGPNPILFGSAAAGSLYSDSGCTVALGRVFPADSGERIVFNLPEGYTLNSESANIANNVWRGSPVPTPGALALLLGAAGVIPRRRR